METRPASAPAATTESPRSEWTWWQEGVLYQVYPRSFQDSDGDGVGDLPGILSRVDYLEWLGVDAVWLSPVFESPQADFGYDISDYRAVDPLFGTERDLAALRDALHERGMRLLLDLVPNHSSDRHPWFQASRSARSDPKRDWYIWADPASDGGPPNNWLSVFGGSAWEWDDATGQYYYHAFLKEQPDLNWRNPEVRAAMLDVMRYWLEWGADGFRVDVMWHLIKDDQLRDNPPAPDYDPETATLSYDRLIPAFSTDQPEVHDVVAEMRRVMDEYGDRLLIGEIYLPVPQLVDYYGVEAPGAHLPFNFQLVTLPWDRERIEAAIAEYEGALPDDAWPNWVLSNHDRPRVAGRWGVGPARAAATLLLTLRGTPTVYYGDELAIGDVHIPPERVHDPQAIRDPGSPSRDAYRTPMQWDGSPRAGFSSAEPWLPLTDDHAERNVAAQRDDPGSMLRLYRDLIRLRKERPALVRGRYEPVPGQGEVLAFIRDHGGERLLVLVNFGGSATEFQGPYAGNVLLSTTRSRDGGRVGATIPLAGDEALVVELDPVVSEEPEAREREPRDGRESGSRAAAPLASEDPAESLRGGLFTGLDRLAFALELEAARAVERGDEDAARRLEDQRLGVRLAQRFVAGVHADEVDPRIRDSWEEYDSRTGAVAGGA